MQKEMIVSSNGHETMVAILEDDLVAEVFVERERHRGVVGNVYKGPRLESAARHAVLLHRPRPGARRLPLRRRRHRHARRVRQARGDDDDEAAARNGGAPRAGERDRQDAAEDRGAPQGRPGDLVQVVKEPLGTKGARLTSHVTMPGGSWCSCRRSITSACRARSSRARSAPAARHRPRVPRGARLHRRRHHPHRRGGRPKEDILGDLDAFHKIWTEMRQRNESSRAPAVLFQEQSIVAGCCAIC
jgi:ribonuclease G